LVVVGFLAGVVCRTGARGLPASGFGSTEALGAGDAALALGAGDSSVGAGGASEIDGAADGVSLSVAGFFETIATTTTATAAKTTITTTGTIQRGRR
jgi:hypothetical protein